MESIKKICNVLTLSALVLMTVCSCSKLQNDELSDQHRKVYTAELVFDGSLTTFDAVTRSSSTSWADGSIVYLQFDTDDNYVDGVAVYDAGTAKWTLEFYGEINSNNKEQVCHAVYIENAVEYGYHDVILDESSIVYKDTDGSYTYDGSLLIVNAHLVPATGRIRFEGAPGYSYTMTGLTNYTRYNIANNTWTSETHSFSNTLPESGKSDYYYVYFSTDMNPSREMQFYDKENNARYEKTFPEGVLDAGKSGFMNIPTIESHNSWASDPIVKTFTVGDVSFNMILVDAGKIIAGPKGHYANVSVSPYRVEVGYDYYIGETEITHGLYSAVTGEIIPKGSAENDPKSDISYNNDYFEPMALFHGLYEKTGISFGLPYENEWVFAACGGLLTQRYLYSGSNNIDDVAWYNCDEPHEVKQKLPNELGLYDMSGNLAEFVCESQGSRYEYGEFYGGSYDSSEYDCMPLSWTYYPGGQGARLFVAASTLKK